LRLLSGVRPYLDSTMRDATITVLVCGADGVLSDIVTWNLERRGFRVIQHTWASQYETPNPPVEAVDVVVVDLDSPDPSECWSTADRLRESFRQLPIIFLADHWPGSDRLQTLLPCTYRHKPIAIDDLLAALRERLPCSGV
jgi:DNA-binding response OmpR family regulator